MKRRRHRVMHCTLAAAIGMILSGASSAGEIAADLQARLQSSDSATTFPIIVRFTERVDPNGIRDNNRKQRRKKLVDAMKTRLAGKETAVTGVLSTSESRAAKRLWLINGMALNANAARIAQIAARPGVASVSYDASMMGPTVSSAPSAPATWNLTAVGAPSLWQQGYTGQGAVIAVLDSGVDSSHPDIGGKWRGGSNSWFDPYGQHATPADLNGHGTAVTGLIVGGEASGNAIGMAPSAKWIAAKIFNDSNAATNSGIHLSLQWLLDPDGNSATDDAPDVANNSWGLINTVNACNPEFHDDLVALQAADIAVVFAAGNSGPYYATSLSPANDVNSLAAGSIDSSYAIASSSSRGPNACTGGVFPNVVAPGENVMSADLTFGGLIPNAYTYVAGTSFAAPHVSGAIALLKSAVPSATAAQIGAAIQQSARDIGAPGADNDAGNGLLDVPAALATLQAAGGSGSGSGSGTTPAAQAVTDSYSVNEDTTLNVVSPGVLGNDSGTSTLTANLVSAPSHGTLTLNTNGGFSYVPTANYNGSDAFTYSAHSADGADSVATTVSLAVAPVNDLPVSTDDAYSIDAGKTLTIATPGILANDSDADQQALSTVLVSTVAHGTLTLNANGGFTYVPATGYAGADSFTYRASDGSGTGNVATVRLTVNAVVNTAPKAVNDSATVARNGSVVIAVLANDTDAEKNIDAATVSVVSAASNGTTVINANGSVTYTPKRNYRGTDKFKYVVKDTSGATSNQATVTVTVK